MSFTRPSSRRLSNPLVHSLSRYITQLSCKIKVAANGSKQSNAKIAAAIKFEHDCEASGGYDREELDSVVASVLERAVGP
jgi:hypothetical protein